VKAGSTHLLKALVHQQQCRYMSTSLRGHVHDLPVDQLYMLARGEETMRDHAVVRICRPAMTFELLHESHYTHTVCLTALRFHESCVGV
jgi:predicted NAD/FAD-binding protein